MQFQGGKARQAKAIGQLLKTVDRPNYLEPFVGGAWVLKEVASHFQRVVASDLHRDLILLYQALQQGWEPPSDVTEEDHSRLKHAEPSALRGFVGYGCSWGGAWFHSFVRGHTSPATGARSLMRKAPLLTGVNFRQCDYAVHYPGPSAVVYCDPPYLGRDCPPQCRPFDHSRFWKTMNAWSDEGSAVFVSEESAPEGWSPVLTTGRRTGIGLDNTKTYVPEYVWSRSV